MSPRGYRVDRRNGYPQKLVWLNRERAGFHPILPDPIKHKRPLVRPVALAIAAIVVALLLSGCSGIGERAEDIRAKASSARDRYENFTEGIDEAVTARARNQLCHRMSVDQLYRNFGGMLEQWATLCGRPVPPEKETRR